MHSMSASERNPDISANQPICKGRCVLFTLVPSNTVAEESVHVLAFVIQKNEKSQKNNFLNYKSKAWKTVLVRTPLV